MSVESLWDYSQPDFYHFDEDSTWLVKEAIKHTKFPIESCLDLFCGCGVIGIEFALQASSHAQISFLELQPEFKGHIEENIKRSQLSNTSVHILDFRQFKGPPFQCILANPPYFLATESRASLDEKRNLCRQQVDFQWRDIKNFVDEFLEINGVFLFLSRKSFEDLSRVFKDNLIMIGKKAKTNLFLYRRLNEN